MVTSIRFEHFLEELIELEVRLSGVGVKGFSLFRRELDRQRDVLTTRRLFQVCIGLAHWGRLRRRFSQEDFLESIGREFGLKLKGVLLRLS